MGGERQLAKKKKEMKQDIQHHLFQKYQQETTEPIYQKIATQDVLSLLGSFDLSEIQSNLKDSSVSFPQSTALQFSDETKKTKQNSLQNSSQISFQNSFQNSFKPHSLFSLPKKSEMKKPTEMKDKFHHFQDQSEEEMHEDFDENDNEMLLEENDFLMQ